MFSRSMPVKINYHSVGSVAYEQRSHVSSLDGFKTFPQLAHLDLSCNQIKNIKLNVHDYEILDVRPPWKRLVSDARR